MGAFSDNFYSWLDRQHAAERAAMDSAFKHPDGSECKATKPENCPFYRKAVSVMEMTDNLDANRGKDANEDEGDNLSPSTREEKLETFEKYRKEALSGKYAHYLDGYLDDYDEISEEFNLALEEDNTERQEALLKSIKESARSANSDEDWGEYELKEKHSNLRAKRNSAFKALKGFGRDDGTYDLETVKPKHYDSGYSVSFQEETTEEEGSPAYKTNEQYDRIVVALSRELNASPDLGVFSEPELSFHVDSLDKALEVARRHNQVSIWDWSASKEIPNKDFVGQLHYRDRDNHNTKRYHTHKTNPSST